MVIHVNVVTPAGTTVAEKYKLEPSDTFNDLLELGKQCVNNPRDVLRLHLLSPSGEQLKQGRKVAAAKIKNGDTLTFVIISRDPRAEDWIARVQSDPSLLKCAPEYARSDPVVVMEAVKHSGSTLGYAVPELRGDKELVSMAVSKDGKSLQYASAELRDDKEVALKAVLQHGRALEFASERLRGDFEIVHCACTNEGNSLEFATPEWQRDEKMVLLAVQRLYQQTGDLRKSQRNLPIQFAAEELRSNSDFMWQAIQLDPRCINHASENIRGLLKEKMKKHLKFEATQCFSAG